MRTLRYVLPRLLTGLIRRINRFGPGGLGLHREATHKDFKYELLQHLMVRCEGIRNRGLVGRVPGPRYKSFIRSLRTALLHISGRSISKTKTRRDVRLLRSFLKFRNEQGVHLLKLLPLPPSYRRN